MDRQKQSGIKQQGSTSECLEQAVTDRFAILRERIIALKRECADAAFCAYLDQKWMELQGTENALYQLEQSIEQGYRQYLARTSCQQPVQSQNMYHMQMEQSVNQQTMYHMQMKPVQQSVSAQPVQSVFYTAKGQPAPVYHPQLQQQAAQPAYVQPSPQAVYNQPAPYSRQENPQKSVEFKVGTVIFGVVGIAFLLVAFITFGLNFMNNILQGIFLYAIGIVLIASSELFVFKRIEKFSYCLTGLGISSLYVVTLLNYIYLAIFPAWVALLITLILTSFFFYLSRKKDSGMIRIICLIGCYLSLVPIHQLKSQLEFLMPALVVFLVNLAGVYCPVKKRRKVVDHIQYICSFSVIFYLIYPQWLSGLQMWPVYVLVCADILTLHLVVL